MNRRNFIKTSTTVAVGATLTSGILASPTLPLPRPICIFSKCLQFLDYGEMGEFIAKLGFDGADLTVRRGGHVLPENVEKELPRAVNALHKAGTKVPMIVTSINDANDLSERILGTASELGIKYYRMGTLSYDPSKSVIQNLDGHKFTIEKLEKINRKYQIHGDYQNHSGSSKRVGAPVWDLYHLMKGLDPEFIGVQYDVMHATVEGNYSWQLGFNLISPWIKTLDFKDFIWKQDNTGKWIIQVVHLGQGMVNYNKYLEEIKQLTNPAPVSIHYEYDLGGAEHGKLNPQMDTNEIYQKLSKDLSFLKKVLS